MNQNDEFNQLLAFILLLCIVASILGVAVVVMSYLFSGL